MYRIGEAARVAGVSPATLRVWERQGVIRSRRSPTGHRLYSRGDLARLVRVRRLRSSTGVNAAAIALLLAGSPSRSEVAGVSMPWGVVVGSRLRQLRRRLGMSLTQASSKAGLSPSFVSMVERGIARPSASTLRGLCATYGTTIREVMGPQASVEKRLVRANGRRVLGVAHGVKIEQLAEGNLLMDCQLFTIAPGAGSGGAYAHDCEEFLFVLRGRLEVVINDADRYLLGPGDSLYFDSTLPHSWRNPGRTQAAAVWINTPPNYSESLNGLGRHVAGNRRQDGVVGVWKAPAPNRAGARGPR